MSKVRIGAVLSFLAVTIVIQPSFAGKVEDVQAAVKAACAKDLPSADALRLVKDLFLSCTPGTQVDAGGCQVKCLKENAGAVVGQ